MEIEEGTIQPESQYRSLTEQEVKEIALAIYKEQAIASWQIPPEQVNGMLEQVFIPLMFMSPVQLLEMQRDKIAHLVGYMKDAMPRSINGFPTFSACIQLTQSDSERIVARIRAIKEAIDGA